MRLRGSGKPSYLLGSDLPVEHRLRCLDQIYQFPVFVEQQGYVAVDFYDGSIIYDFEHRDVKICDIDFYVKRSYTNEMGRMWGSSRFMSPEEFELGATIDGVTNVFSMGAAAFVLAGGIRDRSRSAWEAGEALHRVALKAVSPQREDRYASVADFLGAWLRARKKVG